MQPGGRTLPPGFLDRLADAIVSVEYYMETLQAGRADPWYMLDNAQSCVQALEQTQTPSLPTVPPLGPDSFAKTVQIATVGGTIIDVGDPGGVTHVGGTGFAVPPVVSPSRTAVVRALQENADPELVKLFIEEAHEELTKIQRHFPAWDQNPMDRESLVTVRRSFHTLKGSGRMVGARDLGEFAWSIENLLNRVLDNTLTRTPAILAVLREAVEALPELIAQLENGTPPQADMTAIAARAHALAAGKQPATTARAVADADESPAQPGGTATFSGTSIPGAPKPAGQVGASNGRASPAASDPNSLSATFGATAAGRASSSESHPATQVLAHPAAAARAGVAPRAGNQVAAPAGTAAAPTSPAPQAPPKSAPTVAAGANGATSAPAPVVASKPSAPSALPLAATPVATVAPAQSTPSAAPATVAPAAQIAARAGIAPPVAAAAAPAATSTAAVNGQPAGLDDVLREIYSRETNTHVATVRAFLEREATLPEPHVLPEDVYRACHTLSGSSKMAQARHGTRIAEPLDHWLRRAFSSGLGLTQRDLGLLSDCMAAMETVASHLDEPTGYFVTHWGLQERIAEADKALDQRITAATAARAAEEAAANGAASEDAMPEEEVDTPDDAGDFDPEVAAIFTEEATELIEVSEQALGDWRSEPASAEYRLALKRPLHTLKGGARMAGIMAMGDLSHELETLVMQVDNGSVAADDTLFEVVQASLDELARMRELVANGRRVSPARAMIARIHSLTRPKSAQQPAAAAKAAAAPARPVAPAVAPVRASASGQAGSSPFFSEQIAEIAAAEPDIDLTQLGADPEPEATPPQDTPYQAQSVEQPADSFAPADASEPSAPWSAAAADDLLPESPESESGFEVTEHPGEAEDLGAPGWPNIADAQPSPEQAWLKDTSSEPWPAELAPQDPSELSEAHESGEAANATAFLNTGFAVDAPDNGDADAESASNADQVVPHPAFNADTGGAFAAQLDASLGDETPASDVDGLMHAEAPAEHIELGSGAGDADMIVVEDGTPLDSLPAVEPPPSEIERLSATGVNATLTELESAAAEAAATPPPTPPASISTPAVAKSVSISFERRSEPRASDDGLLPPQPVPPGREPVAPAERQEMARVDAELLDNLLNISGEASIARSRLEQQLGSFDFNLGELSRTVTRLKEQLRSLEIETEAQILHRHEDDGSHRSDFDPLELDRYSSIQQFSRALAETANDVASIQQLLENLAKDTQSLLQQQARTITELQNGLMRTRMVPFQRHVQRLARIVRQAASDTSKRCELIVEGASGELDRQVLERMLPPFEHMLRNAVVHGIETPEERVRAGKPEGGRIVLELHREGAEVMVRLTDDGAGMNLKAIRAKGQALGLIAPGQVLSDEDAMQLILEPGFSTAGSITQQAGRGVGMDVVATEIKRLGGALHMETKAGEGTVFTIRLPFTLAISHALVVRTGEEFYALPLPTVEGVLRLSKAEVMAHLGRDAALFDYGGQKYRFQHLATFVHLEPSPLPEQDVTIPVVLVRAGEHSTGLVADELVGSREIVVKSVGPQISSIRGISGATILGDGRIVIILDIGALVRAEWRSRPQTPVVPKEKADKRVFAMVVDDSITVRRVTQRLLERNGMRVLTARDGMDAVALLQDNIPDIILLDIEMPRMDGYEVAAHVRNDPRLKDVPIIMITSRVGEKHRARAIELGVDDYLGKPYQEAQLLEAIAPLVERRRMAVGSHLYAAELG
jgi:chemosensory pili system protein ChpA (sensor histidine kinase/response regulator)